jgi:hypothetical protein
MQRVVDSLLLENVDQLEDHAKSFKTDLKILWKLPRTEHVEDTEEQLLHVQSLEQGLSPQRLAVMILGVCQCFGVLFKLDIDWPPLFLELVFYVSLISLNFEFFHAECSAKMSFWKVWLIFYVLPVIVLMPLTAAYMLAQLLMPINAFSPKNR